MSYCENFRINGKRINELEIKEGECVKFNSLQYQKSTSEIIGISYSIRVTKKNNLYEIKNNIYFIFYIFDKDGKLLEDMNHEMYVDKSGPVFCKIRSRNSWAIIFGPGNISNELCQRVPIDDFMRKLIMYNSGYKITEYYLKDKKVGEVHVDSNQIIDIWNPKDIKLEIPRIMKYIFLHIYFLLKIIMGNKLNNKDLRQYIFRFLFDLN
jgi:hypothetical protein